MIRQSTVAAVALGSTLFLAVAYCGARAVPVEIPTQQPAPNQVASADVTVIGKVESIQEKTVKAKHYQPGVTGDVEYQIAVVKIEDGLVGAKGLTHIQVAFLAGQNNVPNPGGGKRPFRGQLPVNLVKDQEACFFLTKHPTEAFYVAVNYYDVVDKKTADFDKYTALAKKCAKAIEEPEKALKSKDADEKLLAVSLLLTKYRSPKFGGSKLEAIGADESKLILAALAEKDWAKNDPDTGMNALGLFFMRV